MNISDDLLIIFYAIVFYVVLVIIDCIKDEVNILDGLKDFFAEWFRWLVDFFKVAIPIAIILWAWFG